MFPILSSLIILPLIGSLFLMTPYRLLSGHNYFEMGSIDLTSHLWSISSEVFAYAIFPLSILISSVFIDKGKRKFFEFTGNLYI